MSSTQRRIALGFKEYLAGRNGSMIIELAIILSLVLGVVVPGFIDIYRIGIQDQRVADAVSSGSDALARTRAPTECDLNDIRMLMVRIADGGGGTGVSCGVSPVNRPAPHGGVTIVFSTINQFDAADPVVVDQQTISSFDGQSIAAPVCSHLPSAGNAPTPAEDFQLSSGEYLVVVEICYAPEPSSFLLNQATKTILAPDYYYHRAVEHTRYVQRANLP